MAKDIITSPLRKRSGGVLLAVRLVPNASKSAIDGVARDADGGAVLKVRVTAIPEKGKANDAVVALLAETLGVRRQDISISSGGTSPRKSFIINNLSDSEIRSRLPGPND